MIHQGASLREALRYAERRGCRVSDRRRTGEKVIVHRSEIRPVVVNGRRKDAPRALIRYLNKRTNEE